MRGLMEGFDSAAGVILSILAGIIALFLAVGLGMFLALIIFGLLPVLVGIPLAVWIGMQGHVNLAILTGLVAVIGQIPWMAVGPGAKALNAAFGAD